MHEKIKEMGFPSTDRTTRLAVAVANASYRAGHRRVFRPSGPEQRAAELTARAEHDTTERGHAA